MSVDTVGMLGPQWEIRDIMEFIEARWETNVEFEGTHTPDYTILRFLDRRMSVFSKSTSPFGRIMHLTLGADNEGKEIMRTIVEHFGGLYQPTDGSNDFTLEEGVFFEECDLAYFLRYHLIHDGDPKDLESFHETIKKWNLRIYGQANLTI